ncbi:MAG: tetratricopeptide repeat protein, partial [Ginsengibacter sp.]
SNNWKPKYYLALLYKEKNQIAESRKLFSSCGSEPGFAPFYAARAEILGDVDSEQALSDLKKAIDLEKNEWRYSKLLGEYYIQHNENEKALAVIGPFYKTHSDNYIIGTLYAKTLLLNKRYNECSNLLSKIDILPFEGATIGRELYHEAELMQAINEIRKKNYTKALSFINDAKKWPENLGVGKPYQENIDERLEHWMTHLCYERTGKQAHATHLLQKIIDFRSKIDNPEINFLPANDLITAWAVEKLHTKREATEWLQEEVKKYPDNKTIQWCQQIFEGEHPPTPGNSNSGIRLVEELSELK